MTFLPIVGRELRTASRRGNTYWTRSSVALGATVTAACFFGLSFRETPQEMGQYTFIGLSLLAMGYCLVSGRLFTADCLSSEKREGTLGLLFLTDLKGYDVVLGKLAATSLKGLYGLLAILPVLAMPLLMGGVSQEEFWRVALVLINTFFFSLGAGIFTSALSEDSRRAFGANFSLLLLLIALPPACAGAIYFSTGKYFIPQLLYSCPVYSLWLCFVAGRVIPQSYHFWWSVGIVHALGWGLVLSTSWMAPHCWQDRPSGNAGLRWRDRWRQWSYGKQAVRKAFRKRLLDLNAFYWLASRARLKPALVWSFLVFMVGWWVYVSIRSGSFLMIEALIAMALILNSTLKLWIPIEAAQRLAEDQSAGALELLLSTPLTVRDIVRGQFMALRRQFLSPFLMVILIELIMAATLLQQSRWGDDRMLRMWLAGILMLVADVLALIWVALWAALSSKNVNQAIIKTLGRVLVLPWVLFGVVGVAVSLWVSLTRKPEPSWRFYLGLWFWAGLLTDLVFGVSAWVKVRSGFQEVAARGVKPTRD